MRGMSIDLLDVYPLFLSHNKRSYGFGMAVSLGLRHGWLDGWPDGRTEEDREHFPPEDVQ